MAGSRWREWLGQDEGAEADFIAWLEARKAQCQRDQDAAMTWEATLEARGQKKSLDAVLKFVTMSQQEERVYAKLRSIQSKRPT